MRHAHAEQWARTDSFIHRLHPSAKIICTVALLIGIAFLRRYTLLGSVIYLLFLIALTVAANLHPVELMRAATKVLPFTGIFALISAIAGDQTRGWMLLERSYPSCYCALLLVATTPVPALIRGLAAIRVPAFLLLVMQFLFRYVAVLFAEGAAIRDAGASRGGTLRNLQFRHAGAAAAVLFARSYQRSWAIHQAMVARGFQGQIPGLHPRPFTLRDASAVLLISIISLSIGVALH